MNCVAKVKRALPDALPYLIGQVLHLVIDTAHCLAKSGKRIC